MNAMSADLSPPGGLPLRFDLEVPSDGRVEVKLPLPAGSHVTLFVVEQAAGEFDELIAASVSSTDFWDNPQDDEDWNNA
jgi:hypothetical protein